MPAFVCPVRRSKHDPHPQHLSDRHRETSAERFDQDLAAATAGPRRINGFMSGDMGLIRPDGGLVLTGRIKDLYRTGGELVSPREVESVITALEGVSTAYVVGVPDARWGETGWAFVVRTPGSTVTADGLIQHCRDRLAKYKVPRQVRFLDIESVPKTASGKIQKTALIALAQTSNDDTDKES